MKTSEIINTISEFASAAPKKGQYKYLMDMGRCIPSSAAQVKVWFRCGCRLGVLGRPDVEFIDSIMSEAGLVADYNSTKSGKWVRLENVDDFIQALKQKYGVSSKINTVAEAMNEKNARIREMQIEQLREKSYMVDAIAKNNKGSYRLDSVFDEEFRCSYPNVLTEEDVRNIINVPANVSVVCSHYVCFNVNE